MTPVQIAAQMFCAVLREELGDDTVDTIANLNAIQADAGVCHSHDFCDANMVMDEALRRAGHNMEWDPEVGMPQETVDVWNAAWTLAKSVGFDAAKVGA